MYKGKYSRERRRRPALWAALALALVLTLSVGGTVAYLFTNTESVTNTFTPAETKIDIEEKFDGEKKTSITVKNEGNIDVYVRVMLVATYQNDEGVCATHTAELNSLILPDDDYNSTDWIKGSDGYYYYKTAVAAGKTTNDLLKNGTTITLYEKTDDGCKEHIDVLAQAIQAQPDEAVQQAWSSDKVTVSVGTDGNLTVSPKTK